MSNDPGGIDTRSRTHRENKDHQDGSSLLKSTASEPKDLQNKRSGDVNLLQDGTSKREKCQSTCQSDNGLDVVELALAEALRGATAAGEWTTVAQLARELQARREARTADVIELAERRRKG